MCQQQYQPPSWPSKTIPTSRPDITCKIPQLGQPLIPLFMYTEAHCLLKLDDPFMYIKANSDWEKVSHLCKISRYRSNFWFVHHFGLFQANYYKVKHLNQVGFIHKIKWSILKKNIGSHDHLRPHDSRGWVVWWQKWVVNTGLGSPSHVERLTVLIILACD